MDKGIERQIVKDIAYIKAKIESEESHAKEHRSWEVSQFKSIHKKLDKQDGRIGNTEVQLGWFKGISAVFSILIGWIFKRTF